MSLWVLVFISGLLCTQIVNPFFYYRIVRSVNTYHHAMLEFRQEPELWTKPKYLDYLENEEIGGIVVGIIGNVICFTVGSALSWAIYYFNASDRSFSQFIVTAWFFAIGNFISSIITFATAREFRRIEFLQTWACAIIMFTLCIASLIYGGIYNFSHHVNASTFLTEPEVPVISLDISNTLEKEVLIQGYPICKPIRRNGKIIYPLSRTGNISIIGYVELKSDGTPVIVLKDLHYTPYQSGSQNLKYIARDFLPTKQFFSSWSFQLSPEGDVYFATVYGKFASLRAGRIVEGILLINATTGECLTYPLGEVPNWISGISE